jgi:hypothetical protein
MSDEQQYFQPQYPAGEIKGPDPNVWGPEAREARGATIPVMPESPDLYIPWRIRLLAWFGRHKGKGTSGRGPS